MAMQTSIDGREYDKFKQNSSDGGTDVRVYTAFLASLDNNRMKVTNAADCVLTLTWSDFGTNDERLASVVYSSASLSLTVTKTLSYSLVSSKYRLNTITWS